MRSPRFEPGDPPGAESPHLYGNDKHRESPWTQTLGTFAVTAFASSLLRFGPYVELVIRAAGHSEEQTQTSGSETPRACRSRLLGLRAP